MEADHNHIPRAELSNELGRGRVSAQRNCAVSRSRERLNSRVPISVWRFGRIEDALIGQPQTLTSGSLVVVVLLTVLVHMSLPAGVDVLVGVVLDLPVTVMVARAVRVDMGLPVGVRVLVLGMLFGHFNSRVGIA